MGARSGTAVMELGEFRLACGFCSLRELCWPIGLSRSELARLQSIVRSVGPLPVGRNLFRVGDPFTAIYAVRSGCIKSYIVDAGGREVVHGFHVRGELLGFDAVHPDSHRCSASVIEAASACVIPYRDLARVSLRFPSLNTQLVKLMSREFSKQLTIISASGAVRRVATFLLDILVRLREPGFTQNDFRLPMSREDIANYLGVTAETLSRLMSQLQKRGLVAVDRRQIRLLDVARLDRIANGGEY